MDSNKFYYSSYFYDFLDREKPILVHTFINHEFFSLSYLLSVALNRTHPWPRGGKRGAGTTCHTERLHRTARGSGDIQNKSDLSFKRSFTRTGFSFIQLLTKISSLIAPCQRPHLIIFLSRNSSCLQRSPVRSD